MQNTSIFYPFRKLEKKLQPENDLDSGSAILLVRPAHSGRFGVLLFWRIFTLFLGGFAHILDVFGAKGDPEL